MTTAAARIEVVALARCSTLISRTTWTWRGRWRGCNTHQHTLTQTRSFSSTANPQQQPQAQPLLISQLPPIAEAAAAYNSTPSLSTLTPLIAALNIHQHVYQLTEHLTKKLNSNSHLYEWSNTRSAQSPLTFIAVNISSLHDELLSERIVKAFQVSLPQQYHIDQISINNTTTMSPSVYATQIQQNSVLVESDWRTERNKIRNMGVQSHHMRVLLHVPVHVTSSFPSSLAAYASVLLDPAFASYVLVDVDESGHSSSAAVLSTEIRLMLDLLPVLFGLGTVSREQFVWLFSVLCTYPSDFAFDVISEALST